MPERDWRLRIHDITVAIEKIERYTADMTLAEFQSKERKGNHSYSHGANR
jgi:uncharacterized protein with HEPN domain